jgi:hypothetical protein
LNTALLSRLVPIYQPSDYEREFGVQVEEPGVPPSAREPVAQTTGEGTATEKPREWTVGGVVAIVIVGAGAVASFALLAEATRPTSPLEDPATSGWSLETAALVAVLSWLGLLVGTVAGLVCWLNARIRDRRNWPAKAATLLGVGTAAAWVLLLFG